MGDELSRGFEVIIYEKNFNNNITFITNLLLF